MHIFSIHLLFIPILVCSFLSGMGPSVPVASQMQTNFSSTFKLHVIELLRKKQEILTKEGCKSEIVGNFFCYDEIDSNAANEDLNCIKAFDTDTQFRHIKLYTVVAVNNKRTHDYCKELEALPMGDAINKVRNTDLILTCEAYQSKELVNPVRLEYL